MNKIFYIILFLVLSLFTFANLENDTVGYYKLEDLTEEKSGHDLTNVGATSGISGIIDNAYDFETSESDYLYRSLPVSFDTNIGSWSLWFKPESLTYGTLIGVDENGLSATDFFSITYAPSGNNEFRILYRPTLQYGHTSKGCTLGTWCHIVLTSDGSEWKIYINGTEDNITMDAGLNGGNWVSDTSATHFRIGAINSNSVDVKIDGIIDEVAIFNTNISHENITYLYNSGSPNSNQQYPYSVPFFNISVIYPEESKKYNALTWNRSIIVNSTNELTNCDINITGYSKSNGLTKFEFYRASLNDGNYTFFINCTDVYNQEKNYNTSWIVYDNTFPTININNPINNTEYHTSIINFSIYYYDYYLWKTNTTIYNSSGTIFYNNYSGELSFIENSYNVTTQLNLSDGTYYGLFEATDTHTNNIFNETPLIFSVSDLINNITVLSYQMKYGTIVFETDIGTVLNSYKITDRVIQEFVDENKKKNKSLKIKADKIIYLEDSPYKCHLIINDYYWWDCEGLENVKIKVVDSTEVEIKYDQNQDSVFSESLGGLNYINKTILFSINTTIPIIPNSTTNATTTTTTQEIKITFGNVNLVFGLLLTIILFFIGIKFNSSFFYLMGIFSGLIFLIKLYTLNSDFDISYKFIISAIYVYFIYKTKDGIE